MDALFFLITIHVMTLTIRATMMHPKMIAFVSPPLGISSLGLSSSSCSVVGISVVWLTLRIAMVVIALFVDADSSSEET